MRCTTWTVHKFVFDTCLDLAKHRVSGRSLFVGVRPVPTGVPDGTSRATAISRSNPLHNTLGQHTLHIQSSQVMEKESQALYSFSSEPSPQQVTTTLSYIWDSFLYSRYSWVLSQVKLYHSFKQGKREGSISSEACRFTRNISEDLAWTPPSPQPTVNSHCICSELLLLVNSRHNGSNRSTGLSALCANSALSPVSMETRELSTLFGPCVGSWGGGARGVEEDPGTRTVTWNGLERGWGKESSVPKVAQQQVALVCCGQCTCVGLL